MVHVEPTGVHKHNFASSCLLTSFTFAMPAFSRLRSTIRNTIRILRKRWATLKCILLLLLLLLNHVNMKLCSVHIRCVSISIYIIIQKSQVCLFWNWNASKFPTFYRIYSWIDANETTPMEMLMHSRHIVFVSHVITIMSSLYSCHAY